MALLEVHDIHTYYGKIHALKGVSITVDEGEIVTLIGANGAGKTTTLGTISGLLVPKQGHVNFDGEDMTHVKPHEVVVRGVVQVPEGRRVFARLTVEENLHMGAFTVEDPKLVQDGVDSAYEMFPRLKERRNQLAGTLSGGEQQMLAIERINGEGTAILLVEQNAATALQVASRGYVLQTGQILLADTSAALAANEDVRRSYLGEI